MKRGLKALVLHVNGAGDSCLKNWTNEELRLGYDVAERENDDVFYMALMSEFERRGLSVQDPPPPHPPRERNNEL